MMHTILLPEEGQDVFWKGIQIGYITAVERNKIYAEYDNSYSESHGLFFRSVIKTTRLTKQVHKNIEIYYRCASADEKDYGIVDRWEFHREIKPVELHSSITMK